MKTLNIPYQIKKKIDCNLIYDVIFGLFIFLSVFNWMIANLILIPLFLLFIFNYKISKSLFYYKIITPSFIIFLVFIFYVYLRMLISGSFDEKTFSLLFFIPVIFFLSLRIRNWNISALSFIIASFVLSICGLFNILMYYLKTGIFDMSNGPNIDPLLIVLRPYLGIILVFSSLMAFYFARKFKRYRFVFYFLTSFFTLYIVFISARMSLLTLFIVFMIYTLFYLKTKKLKKLIYFIACFISLFVIILSTPSLSKRFLLNEEVTHIKSNLKDIDPRILIWNCSLDIIKGSDFNVLFGIGSQEKILTSLTDCYVTKDDFKFKGYCVEFRSHLHNQFFDIYGMYGIIGLFLFSLFFFFQLYKSRKKFTSFALIFSLFLFLMVDVMFYSQKGVFLFTIFFILIINFRAEKTSLHSYNVPKSV